jgi:hypothetical protein
MATVIRKRSRAVITGLSPAPNFLDEPSGDNQQDAGAQES